MERAFSSSRREEYGEMLEVFAELHPHEAAELSWDSFMEICKRKNPAVTATEVKAALREKGNRDA